MAEGAAGSILVRVPASWFGEFWLMDKHHRKSEQPTMAKVGDKSPQLNDLD